jgi:hypothetical protein
VNSTRAGEKAHRTFRQLERVVRLRFAVNYENDIDAEYEKECIGYQGELAEYKNNFQKSNATK